MAVDLEWTPKVTRLLMPFRIQPEVRYTLADYARAARLVVVNHAILLACLQAVWMVHSWAVPKLCAAELPGAFSFILQFFASQTLGECCFYAAHYWMHNSALGWKVHSVHHYITAPQPIHQHYLHPAEMLILVLFTSSGGPGILPLVCFGSHVSVWWVYCLTSVWTGAVGHCGYQIPGLKGLWGTGESGNLYHDYHHYHVAGPEGTQNIGQLPVFDVLFGTNKFYLKQWQGRLDKSYSSPGFPIDRVLVMNGMDPEQIRGE